MPEDRIYQNPLSKVAPFTFDVSVADVFEDMIRRSVPGYGLTLQLMASVAHSLLKNDALCYDLGCSLAAGMLALDRGLSGKSARIVGIDNSKAMLEKASGILEGASMHSDWELIESDVTDFDYEPHQLSVMNFTLQFIPAELRERFLTKIFDALIPEGVLVLSEKVVFEEESENTLQIQMHHDFKRMNGYTDLEISQKRTALENTLIPESIDMHVSRLKNVGFKQVFPWLQAFNFVSLIAIK